MNKTLFIKEDFPFMKKEVNDITKREQLKTAFKKVLSDLIEKYMDDGWLPDYNDRDRDANATAKLLLREVSIRTDLR